jgi:hypothetical protein
MLLNYAVSGLPLLNEIWNLRIVEVLFNSTVSRLPLFNEI